MRLAPKFNGSPGPRVLGPPVPGSTVYSVPNPVLCCDAMTAPTSIAVYYSATHIIEGTSYDSDVSANVLYSFYASNSALLVLVCVSVKVAA